MQRIKDKPATRLRPAVTNEPAPMLEIVIPVYNEQATLEASVLELHGFLTSSFPYSFQITIADNASTEWTPIIGGRLAAHIDGVSFIRIEQKGRGLALREAWSRSRAEVVAYMDVDLSTGLEALLPLVAPLISGHSDIAIGTRLSSSSLVVRSGQREFISRSYNRILRTALGTRISDAQCGFKAGRTAAICSLLDDVADNGWFFDTELLVLAERRGMRIHEVPVNWIEDPDSRVAIVQTALEDLRGVRRMATEIVRGRIGGGASRQLGRFALVGVLSTAFYLLLFSVFRTDVPAQVANGLALGLSAIPNTGFNRSFKFGRRGHRHLARHHTQGLAIFGACLGLTSASLALVNALAPGASRGIEVAALLMANLLGTLLRFVALRLWVFGPGEVPPEKRERLRRSLPGASAAQAR